MCGNERCCAVTCVDVVSQYAHGRFRSPVLFVLCPVWFFYLAGRALLEGAVKTMSLDFLTFCIICLVYINREIIKADVGRKRFFKMLEI